MADTPLTRLRRICRKLPEAEERETWGEPTFRIRNKIFCVYSGEYDRPALTCKAPEGSQAVLVGADPKRFFVPRYVGHIGWVGVWLDGKVDWDEVARLVERSYKMTAPKRGVGKKTAKRTKAKA